MGKAELQKHQIFPSNLSSECQKFSGRHGYKVDYFYWDGLDISGIGCSFVQSVLVFPLGWWDDEILVITI